MCTGCGSPAEAAHWTDSSLAPRGPLSSTGTRLRRAELVTRLVRRTRARVAVVAGHYVLTAVTGRVVVAPNLGELWPALPTSIWAAVSEATAEPAVGVEVDWAGFGVALSAFVYAHRAEYAGAWCRVAVADGPTVRILATPTGAGRLDVVPAGPAALTLSPVAAPTPSPVVT